MTLACWGLARQALLDAGYTADIYVQDSTIEYLQPVWAELDVSAIPAQGHSLADFVAMYAARGKARITLVALTAGKDTAAARLTARFVAKKREEAVA
jgi:thioesterase domain-containing protein